MPVRNGQEFVDEAIESALTQDFEDFELVVVDDGSGDATPEIVRKWARRDARIVQLVLDRHHGISGALNRGLAIARSERIARHDADDIFMPGRLRAQVAALDADPGTVLVSARYEVIDERGRRLYTSRAESPEVTSHLLSFSNAVGGHGQVMFRRELVHAIGGYDERFEVSQDYDLWTRLEAHGRIVVLPMVGMRHRMHSARISVVKADRCREESLYISRRTLSSRLGREVDPDDADAVAAIWRAEGRPTDTSTAHHLLAEALVRSSDAVGRDARRRIRILTASRWATAGAQLARKGRVFEAARCLGYAARWHPAGRRLDRSGKVARTSHSRLRVLFVIASLERGGSEGQLVELIRRTHGVEIDAIVATIAPAGNRRHPDALPDLGVPHFVLAPRTVARWRRAAGAALRLRSLIRGAQPDVVYAWGEHPTLLAVPTARTLGVPVVVARRNTTALPRRRLDLLPTLTRRLEARAELVTANSRAVLEDARARGIPPDRLRLTPNGHPQREAIPEPNGNDVVRLGYVAALDEGKGHDRLVQALSRVHAKTRWRVDLAGDGPLLEELQAAVDRHGLAERVQFLGIVDDIPRFWAQRNAAVLLSDREGSSNALIEAGLAGRPLLATRVPGNAELVSDDAGVLVAPTDVHATATALERIIDDADLRQRLGNGAWQRMQEFDPSTMTASHVNAMREAV
jgi:glycosyltransferase involved in cell wall biosynthesis